MKIQTFVVGADEANAYIIYDAHSSEAVIIDPGAEAQTLMRYIDKHRLKVTEIVLTHYHCDHIGAVEELRKKYKCEVLAHKKEFSGLADPKINQSLKVNREALCIIPTKALSEGCEVKVGPYVFEVVHTPGHTPGGICLKSETERVAFTGDTLFSDDIGRTDLAGGSEQQMKKSLTNKIGNWSESLWIYPGHGDADLLGNIKKRRIPFLTM